MDASRIQAYAAGASLPAAAIAGLNAAELDASPIPGTWSIRQIVLHLADSDLIASERMKRVIAEENPTLMAYDENAFVRNLGYHYLDPHAACELFRLNRLLTADILARQPPQAFARQGRHSEKGMVTLGDLVESYIEHLAHHLKFLHQKRSLLGK